MAVLIISLVTTVAGVAIPALLDEPAAVAAVTASDCDKAKYVSPAMPPAANTVTPKQAASIAASRHAIPSIILPANKANEPPIEPPASAV